MHNYHSTHSCFPPGDIYYNSSGTPYPPGYTGLYIGPGWGVSILPYMEQTQIIDRYDPTGTPAGYGIYADKNVQLWNNRIPAYCCPSDPQDEGLTIYGPKKWWKTNAAGVADSYSSWGPAPTDFLQNPVFHGDGMLMDMKAIRIAEVADGTSNTLFVGEVTGAGPGATAAGV